MRQRKGRALNNLLLLDKPSGITSNKALQKVKRLFKAAKAGHTGSLDPLATGLLIICFGKTTKISQFLLHADKYYEVAIKLGVVTDTGDADGTIIDVNDASLISANEIEQRLTNLTGVIVSIFELEPDCVAFVSIGVMSYCQKATFFWVFTNTGCIGLSGSTKNSTLTS